MRISIVIPSHRATPILRATVRSCFEQEAPGHDLEVIVVANPPNPALEEEVREWAEGSTVPWRVVGSEPAGVNRARNRGIEESRGEVVLFLDDDCVLKDAKCVERLAALHAERSEADGIGGRYAQPEDAGRASACRFYNGMLEFWLEGTVREDGSCGQLLGGSASYKRRVFEARHRFDASIEYGGDETEFNERLVRDGRRLELAREVEVVHRFGGTWPSVFERAWKHGRGMVRRAGGESRGGGDRRARRGDGRASGSAVARRESAGVLARVAGLETAPRPRWVFLGFLVAFRVVVLAGRWAERWRRAAAAVSGSSDGAAADGGVVSRGAGSSGVDSAGAGSKNGAGSGGVVPEGAVSNGSRGLSGEEEESSWLREVDEVTR